MADARDALAAITESIEHELKRLDIWDEAPPSAAALGTCIDNKICMQRRNHGLTATGPLQACSLNQTTGGVTLRVLEK